LSSILASKVPRKIWPSKKLRLCRSSSWPPDEQQRRREGKKRLDGVARKKRSVGGWPRQPLPEGLEVLAPPVERGCEAEVLLEERQPLAIRRTTPHRAHQVVVARQILVEDLVPVGLAPEECGDENIEVILFSGAFSDILRLSYLESRRYPL
jgi:hypothetical protein